MTSEGTGGESETPQFLRGGTERLGKKDAVFAKLSGPGDDHLDADALLTPASSRLPGSGEDGMAASGALPYDPHTNYLSPRPQFLRYDPGRVREIYHRREMGPEGAEGDSSGEGTPASPLPSPLPRLEHGLGGVEPTHGEESCEDVGVEDDHVDEDTTEEERPSWGNLVWKVLLLLGIFFSVTWYISSMHTFSASSDGFCREVEGEQLQEGKCVVNNLLDPFVDDVTTNSDMVGRGDWSVGSAGELQGETPMKVPENSDLRCTNNNRDLKDFLAMSGEEGDEIVADESKPLVNNENLTAGVAPVEGLNEVFMNAGVAPVEAENEVFVNADAALAEAEEEGFMSMVCDPEEENRHTRDTISEEQVGDVMVASEIEEPVDMALEMDKAAESPGRGAVSDRAEKDGSFGGGGGGGGGFSLYGIKVAVTVLMAIAFAATFTFLRFPGPREPKTLVRDDASTSSPTSGWASEGGFELPAAEKLKRDFDLLANTGRIGDHESYYCPVVELLRERPSDSSISTDKYEELHGTLRPTVELLGEFSVAELGFSRTGHYSMGKKNTKTNGRHQQSPEMSMSNSLATVDQSSPESSTSESALRRQPDQEKKLERKQKTRQGSGAREAASTPLRRSSRIRNRVASP